MLDDDADEMRKIFSGNELIARTMEPEPISNHYRHEYSVNNHHHDRSQSSIVGPSTPSPTILSNHVILAMYRCPFTNIFNYTTHDLDLLLTYKHYISGWACLLVILVGLVANSITICALLHRYMRKSSTNAYLLALAFSNLCSLLCLLLMIGARFTFVHPYRLVYCKSWYENFVNISMPYLTPINNMFQLSGIYLIMAVSIDRLVIVRKQVKPTIGNRRRRKLLTWLVIMAIFLFSFLFTLPNWFLYESERIELNIFDRDLDFARLYTNGGGSGYHVVEGTNKKLSATRHTQEGNSNGGGTLLLKLIHYKTKHTKFGSLDRVKELLGIYLYIPFVFGIPIVVLVGVNTLIIYELVKISARKRQLGTAARLDRNITLMLVAIVLVFLVCQVPLTISHMLIAYQPELMFNKHFFVYNSFTSFLTCVNLSANFGLFLFFGQAFRDTLQFMFCLRDSLPEQHSKRAPSLFFNTTTAEFSRRGSSLIQSVYHTFTGGGSRKNSAASSAELRFDMNGTLSSSNRYTQHRKSLPAVLMEKIIEKEDMDQGGGGSGVNGDFLGVDYDCDEATSFGKQSKRSNSKGLTTYHVHFKDSSVVSKSSSSLKSNRIRRFSEQFHKPADFCLK